MTATERAIGIDLGTFNSAAAVALGRDNVVMVQSRAGQTQYGKQFPSFVLFDYDGHVQAVGQPAKAAMPHNPTLVVWGVKRLVGLSYEEAKAKGEFDRFSYQVEPGPGGSILIKVGPERYSPSHILEFILRAIREDVSNANANPMLGQAIDRAVVSVPAYFKATRTDSIVTAAKRAGFTEVRTIAEPTAAALRYGLEIAGEANLLAFDLGAGTLDVTVMQVVSVDGILAPGELSTSGHEALGGLDMDDRLVTYIAERHGLDVAGDPGKLALLKSEVELTKIRLSIKEKAVIDLPNGESVDLTRAELEKAVAPLLERCRGPIRSALDVAGLAAREIDHVLLVGGPTHMPCVRRLVADELAKLGARAEVVASVGRGGAGVDPMAAVAQGAALKAARIVEPVGTTIFEGFGTVLGPVGKAANYASCYYAKIIPENSPYPISGKVGIVHSNPDALEVPIPLVAKVRDTEKSTTARPVYRYEYLGDYTLSVIPTGKPPEVQVVLKVTEDKRVVVTLSNDQGGRRQEVVFESLNSLKGHEITCQEDKPPDPTPTPPSTPGSPGPDEKARAAGWTDSQLERLTHAAREILALVKDPRTVQSAVGKLEQALARASAGGAQGPNDVCPDISNRAKELAHRLCVAGQIDQATYDRYREAIIQISKNR